MSERRVPELDGIRGLAILLVIVWHYAAAPGALLPRDTLGGFLYRAGMLTWSGVDLFFVLSGFLIGGILIDARSSPSYFQTFYLRRAFRILPLYILLCIVGTLVVMATGTGRVVGQPMPLILYATFTQNFWLAHHSWDAYMGVTWSLAIEEQFYLTLPFIIRFVNARRIPVVIGALALASAVTRALLYLHFGNEWGTAAYTLMFCRADALMLGVLGALAMRHPGIRARLAEKPGILRAAILVFGSGVMVLLLKGWTMQTRPMSTLGYTCMALFYLSLLLLAVVRSEGWWAGAMRFSPLRWLGGLAYCIYLLHGSTFSISSYLLRGRPHTTGPDWAAAAIGLVSALGLSYLSWRYFESKMIRFGHRFSYAERPRPRRFSEAYVSPGDSDGL